MLKYLNDNKNESKTLIKHISCDCKCKLSNITYN